MNKASRQQNRKLLYFLVVIEWRSVLFSCFWILGAAVLLAGFSYHSWLARTAQEPLRRQLQSAAFLRVFWGALALITAGLAGIADAFWERIIWIAFTLVHLLHGYQEGLFSGDQHDGHPDSDAQ